MAFAPEVVPFDAVLFDLDGTLHDNAGAFRAAARYAAREVASEHAVDAELFWRSYLAEGDLLGVEVADPRARMMEAALRAVGVADASLGQRIARAYESEHRRRLQPFPGVVDLLASLRARAVKVGLVTNGFAATHRERIARLGLDRQFDGLFFADEVGAIKPNPRIFLHACESLGARPARTVMVGDRLDCDVAGGRGAGLVVVWLNAGDEPLPNDAPQPDEIARTIGELAGLFASIP